MKNCPFPALSCGFGVFLLLSIAAAATARQQADVAQSPSLSFLQGTWRTTGGATVAEERWTDEVGGVMLGVSRTLRGDKTLFFEFLRIERRADGGVYYVAQPRGNPPTEFKLTSSEGGAFVFENPKHDFPQKITYQKVDGDTVRASISGPRNDKEASESWEFKRVK